MPDVWSPERSLAVLRTLIATFLLVFSLNVLALQLTPQGCLFLAQVAAKAPEAKQNKVPKKDYQKQAHDFISQYVDEAELKEFDRVIEILVDRSYDSKLDEQVIGQATVDACIRVSGDTEKLVGQSI